MYFPLFFQNRQRHATSFWIPQFAWGARGDDLFQGGTEEAETNLHSILMGIFLITLGRIPSQRNLDLLATARREAEADYHLRVHLAHRLLLRGARGDDDTAGP